MKNSSRFELVMIAKLEPLEERRRRVHRLFEHASVELEPRELAVQEQLRLLLARLGRQAHVGAPASRKTILRPKTSVKRSDASTCGVLWSATHRSR